MNLFEGSKQAPCTTGVGRAREAAGPTDPRRAEILRIAKDTGGGADAAASRGVTRATLRRFTSRGQRTL